MTAKTKKYFVTVTASQLQRHQCHQHKTHSKSTVQEEEHFNFTQRQHQIKSKTELKEASNMAEIQPTKSPKSLYKLALKTYTCNLNNNVTTLDKYGILRGLPPTVLTDIYTRVSETFYVVNFSSTTK